MDITGNDIKLKYRKLASDGDAVVNKNYQVTDLAKALETLLTADSSTNHTHKLRKEGVKENRIIRYKFSQICF